MAGKEENQIPLVSGELLDIALPATGGDDVRLRECSGLTVLFVFPRITTPLQKPIDGWSEIPGAKGCTIQNQRYAEDYRRLREAGADHVFGLSTQPVDYLWEAVQRLHLPYRLLSDKDLIFADTLKLPRFEVGGEVLLERLTIVARDSTVEHVFHPITDPAKNSEDVLAYLAGAA